MKRTTRPVAIAVIVGMLLWFAASAISGEREPWDASIYWVVAYPITIFASGLLGYFHPHRPWRWAILLFAAQFVAMCIRNGELGNLWPLGMLLFVVIALPAMLAAKVASRWNPASSKDP
jgi:peptidoglycan/LPS O-acetylase OafA/YrhL